jgi:exonuclease SbcD
MDRIRGDLARRPAGTQSIVVAHAFVAGAETSESERDLTVGGSASVPPSVFAGVDYLALGHLHGPQKVGDHGRYAGSPLAFSFSEEHQTKSLALVDLEGGSAEVELIPTSVPRPLARLRGTLEELLTDESLARHEQSWIQATITDTQRPAEPMARLRRRFPHALLLGFEPEGLSAAPETSYSSRVRGVSDIDLALRFVDDLRGVPASDEERALLTEAFAAHRTTESEATA